MISPWGCATIQVVAERLGRGVASRHWSATFERFAVARMMKTVEAIIDAQGNVRLLERVRPAGARRALVTILEESPGDTETALLSEAALAEDWNRPEEDEAWSHLQPVR